MQNKKQLRRMACPAKPWRSGGFTLIELLVSVAILIMVIGGAVAVEIQSVKVAVTTKHKLQAAALAQQAMNQVRTIRDTRFLNNQRDAALFTDFTESATNSYKLVPPAVPSGDWTLPPDNNGTNTPLNGVNYNVKVFFDN